MATTDETIRAGLTSIVRGDAAPDDILTEARRLLNRGETFDQSYNGWTNRETWNTHLWMSNDKGSYNEAREIVAKHLAYGPDRGPTAASEEAIRAVAISYAADELREWWDETFAPTDSAGPLSDAWSYAIARTDWRRVAEAFAE